MQLQGCLGQIKLLQIVNREGSNFVLFLNRTAVLMGQSKSVEVWLVGVVVRRYIDILTIIINFPYSTCISSFFGSSIPTSLFIF